MLYVCDIWTVHIYTKVLQTTIHRQACSPIIYAITLMEADTFANIIRIILDERCNCLQLFYTDGSSNINGINQIEFNKKLDSYQLIEEYENDNRQNELQ